MLASPSVSPGMGVFVTSPNHVSHRKGLAHFRRDRHACKSAPPQVWQKRSQLLTNHKSQSQHGPSASPTKILRKCSTADTKRIRKRNSAGSSTTGNGDVKLSVDDVVWLAEQTREMTSLENRRSVLEEAQKTIRQETSVPDSSRPHSVIGVGLQAMTSPMPLSAKYRNRPSQIDHIPTLLSLPSDRTFIPSPDQEHARHMTTPAEEINMEPEERAQSVAKQCCEIMGPSLCRTCRKLESRLLNREQAEKECPRMRITQENITTTQLVKRLYPGLTNSEIQDKIARGEIARTGFPPPKCRHQRLRLDSSSSDNESDDSSSPDSLPGDNSTKKENKKPKLKMSCQHVSTLMLELARMKAKLKNQTSTPLFFTDLKRVQAKIISGEVDRKKYLTKEPKETTRLKSAMSTISTASSTKTTLSKLGVRLSESLMPVFVSPRKVKIHDEPSYKAYYEPPLLSKRRQIPNPSFFAGSSETYSLPERLPDIIEFADSKIKMLEKQGRSMSSMSMISNISEEYDNIMSGRDAESGRIADNPLSMSSSQRDLKKQLVIQEQSEQESHSNHEEGISEVNDDSGEHNRSAPDHGKHPDDLGKTEDKLYECEEVTNNEGNHIGSISEIHCCHGDKNGLGCQENGRSPTNYDYCSVKVTYDTYGELPVCETSQQTDRELQARDLETGNCEQLFNPNGVGVDNEHMNANRNLCNEVDYADDNHPVGGDDDHGGGDDDHNDSIGEHRLVSSSCASRRNEDNNEMIKSHFDDGRPQEVIQNGVTECLNGREEVDTNNNCTDDGPIGDPEEQNEDDNASVVDNFETQSTCMASSRTGMPSEQSLYSDEEEEEEEEIEEEDGEGQAEDKRSCQTTRESVYSDD